MPNYSNLILESNTNNYLSFYTPNNSESAIIFDKGTQAGTGGIAYNSLTNPDGLTFRANNNIRMSILNNGNVAVGNTNPVARLHLHDGPSGYTGLYFPGITIEGSGNRYVNMILPPGNLNMIQFGTIFPEAGFVYDSPATPNGLQFRAKGNHSQMLIAGNGFVGIGNINPAYILDVNERMRIRSAGGTLTAGIWFNNNANNVAAFVGMEDETHVGLFGNTPAGWKFSMNTNTGALKINGSDGASGQAITATGNAAPTWQSVTKWIYDNTVMKLQGADLILTGNNVLTAIPDLTHTFTVNGNAKVVVSMTLNTVTTSCTFCGSSALFVDLQLNNNFVTEFYSDIGNGRDKIFRGEYVISVASGTHTVRLVARSLGPQLRIYGSVNNFTSNMIVEVIPE